MNDGRYKCNLCDEYFINDKKLISHVKNKCYRFKNSNNYDKEIYIKYIKIYLTYINIIPNI
jgi:hypothetical protein